MYHHHIQKMARGLLEAGLATDRQQIELVLSQYWVNKVAVVWTTDDVHSIQEDFDEEMQTSSLSEEQAYCTKHWTSMIPARVLPGRVYATGVRNYAVDGDSR